MKTDRSNTSSSTKRKLKLFALIVTIITLGFIALAWFLYTVIPVPNNDPSRSPGAVERLSETDLSVEADRLQALAIDVAGVSAADVRMRSNITFGRQIIIDATSESTDQNLLEDAVVDLLEIGWNNQLYVPTEVRVGIVDPAGSLVDATSLDYSRQGVGSKYLYDRFGPPAANPEWRP